MRDKVTVDVTEPFDCPFLDMKIDCDMCGFPFAAGGTEFCGDWYVGMGRKPFPSDCPLFTKEIIIRKAD